jgi:ribonuclease T2
MMGRMNSRLALVAVTLALAAAGRADAQVVPPAPSVPPAIELAQYAPHPGTEPRARGGLPGRFDYYALVLSWSPTHCATTDRPEELQCNRRDGRRFSFVLHGLWPQYERGYPEFCPVAERPFVPNSTIERMLDIMPSRGLVVHQYRKHGVCAGIGVESYFDMSRRLFARLKIPPRFVDPEKSQMIDTSEVIDEFVAANPGLKPDMLAVSCGGPGNRLREVRVCFTPKGDLRSCGSNETQRRLCSAPRVFVPPVRVERGEEPPRGGRGRT